MNEIIELRKRAALWRQVSLTGYALAASCGVLGLVFATEAGHIVVSVPVLIVSIVQILRLLILTYREGV